MDKTILKIILAEIGLILFLRVTFVDYVTHAVLLLLLTALLSNFK